MIDPPAVTVRHAAPSDFEALERIHSASVRALARDHYDPETIADWAGPLDRGTFDGAVRSTEYLVAEVLGEPVAFAQLDLGRAEVRMLYVAPEWAGRGVGARLLAELESIAAQRRLPRLVLRSSLNACRFYARMGWVETSRGTHPLRSGREAACVWMAKELGEPPRV